MHFVNGSRLSVALIIAAFASTACGGVIEFRDQAAFAIQGTPPPPPPPPEPEPEPKRVELRDNSIQINEKVQFSYNDSKILEQSFSLLDEVAQVIKDNPHIKKLQIEGHASSEGDDDYNMKLSDHRAKAVRVYLIGKGIAPAMLVAKGFGETKPIADNDTEAGREKNRRVEFNILEQDVTKKKVEIDPKTGKEKVISEEKAK